MSKFGDYNKLLIILKIVKNKIIKKLINICNQNLIKICDWILEFFLSPVDGCMGGWGGLKAV